MNLNCPECNGVVSIDETSSATVFLCPYCGATIKVDKRGEADSQKNGSAVQEEVPSDRYTGAPTSEALEPVTDSAQQSPPPVEQYPQETGKENNFLKDFEEGSIFDKIEDDVLSPGEEPTIKEEVSTTDVKCPICQTVNQIKSELVDKNVNCRSCGSLFSPSQNVAQEFTDDLTGQHIGGCRVVGKIGEGGMGTVYKGIQISLDREVAIKVLPRQYSKNKNFIRRFEREAKSLAKVNHANIMQIYDYGTHGDLFFMIMEYISGKSLSEVIEERIVLPLEELIPVIKQAALGLQCAQKNGVIHRDVKPDNIMIDENEIVKMTDFGLAKIIGASISDLTQDGIRVGTPAFMSPEQCKGEKTLDMRTDIYSLGVTFYLCLSGKCPFTGDSPFSIMLKHQNQKATPLKNLVSGLPDAVSEIVEKMMEKQLDDRYQTWGAFLDTLEAVERYIAIKVPGESGEFVENEKTALGLSDDKAAEQVVKESGENTGDRVEEQLPEPSTDQVSSEELKILLFEGDTQFSKGDFEEAVSTWQKALFLDPNNVEIQDKISEARGRLRQQKIESMLEEANTLEKKGKYTLSLRKIDDLLKLKLSWQVKDMVNQNIKRIQEKMRKKKLYFSIFRLIIIFICLLGGLIVGYPSYLLYRSSVEYKEAELSKKSALQKIDKDIKFFEEAAHKAIEQYENIKRHRIPDKGILGLIYKKYAPENKFIKRVGLEVKDLNDKIIVKQKEKYIAVAREGIEKLEKDEKYIRAKQELGKFKNDYEERFGKAEETSEKISKEASDAVKDLYERVSKKSELVEELYSRALEYDVFEQEDISDIKRLSSYENIERACESYRELSTRYSNTLLGPKAKKLFAIDSNPEGATVVIETDKGMEITIKNKTTPVVIPIHKPNKLFSVRLEKEGYLSLKKKFREGTIDRSSEFFVLKPGPRWEIPITGGKVINSQGIFYNDSLIFLADNRMFSLNLENGGNNFSKELYESKESPVFSKYFNNEKDITLYQDIFLVPGVNGMIYKVNTVKGKFTGWLNDRIDVRPAKEPTAPLVLPVPLQPDKTGVFFGGGKDSGFMGAVCLEDGESLWGEVILEESEEKVKGKEVKGDILTAPLSFKGGILVTTTLGYIYFFNIDTGERKKEMKISHETENSMILTEGKQYVYYFGKIKDKNRSVILKIDFNKEDEEIVWDQEIAGVIGAKPNIIKDNIVFTVMDEFEEGEVIAISIETGKTSWTYPKEGKMTTLLGPGVTFSDNKIFFSAGTDIKILNTGGNLLHDKYSTDGRITKSLLVRGGYIYALTGFGSAFSFLVPPDSKSE